MKSKRMERLFTMFIIVQIIIASCLPAFHVRAHHDMFDPLSSEAMREVLLRNARGWSAQQKGQPPYLQLQRHLLDVCH